MRGGKIKAMCKKQNCLCDAQCQNRGHREQEFKVSILSGLDHQMNGDAIKQNLDIIGSSFRAQKRSQGW